MLHEELTEKIIGSFFSVYNKLGYGFLEKVYENAMCIECRKEGLNVESQKHIQVYYEGEQIGKYCADLVINDLVIIELKAARALDEDHEAQLLNYLRATDKEVGLLFNFGRNPEFRRKIFHNRFKNAERQFKRE
jgi:GxxExxY protein